MNMLNSKTPTAVGVLLLFVMLRKEEARERGACRHRRAERWGKLRIFLLQEEKALADVCMNDNNARIRECLLHGRAFQRGFLLGTLSYPHRWFY